MSTNPYAAPKAAVADDTITLDADFVPGGRAVEAGRGWSWIAAAWDLFRRQPGMWIGIILVLFIILLAASLIPVVGGLLMTLFAPVFAGGLVIGCRALDEGKDLEFNHLFAGFRERTGTLVGVGAVYLAISLAVMLVVGLTMGVGMMAMMGQGDPAQLAAMGVTILLAGLIMFALMLPVIMAVWFAAPLVVFHEHGVMDAMKGSFVGCLRNILPFLIYGVVMFVFSILATLPILLGWLVLGPVLVATLYTGYRDIYFKPSAP
jgi:uncharacterized membrane protein